MENSVYIASVDITGLHGQFDFKINLTPRLNILYGKNGRGKTTLLHIIANTLELDFERFSSLLFKHIKITFSNKSTIEILRERGDNLKEPVKVLLDGNATSFSGENKSLSEAEIAGFRHYIGQRPIYLPAFRSILEKTRVQPSGYYKQSDRKELNHEEIVDKELRRIRDEMRDSAKSGSVVYAYKGIHDTATAIAEKTILCRQWFGEFVPLIRYPSVLEVDESLSNEWRRAAIETSEKEHRMFQETFVKIFEIVSGTEPAPNTHFATEELVKLISNMLYDDEHQFENSENLPTNFRLLEASMKLDDKNSESNKSLLSFYYSALQERKDQRLKAFKKSREFEASINQFLDSKLLRIGKIASDKIGNSLVGVQANGGHFYPLSSLSSGERQILTMLYSASRPSCKAGVFLIDEPEISLHIDWQRIILTELHRQSPNRQIIVCTHSPEVGADHFHNTQDFEPTIGVSSELNYDDLLFFDEEI